MVWQTWQIVLTVIGGSVFLVFEILSIIRNITARKAKKAEAEAVFNGDGDNGDPDGDNDIHDE